MARKPGPLSTPFEPQDPTDALATFLGMAEGSSNPDFDSNNGTADPGVQAYKLRSEQLARGSQPFENPDFMKMLSGERDQTMANTHTEQERLNQGYKESGYISPGQEHQEKFAIDLAHAQHPVQNQMAAFGQNPEADEALIKSMLNYQFKVPAGNVMAREPYVKAIQEAVRRDPTFNMGEYDARQKLRESFTTGKDAESLKSLNALAGHVNKLDAIRKKLGNYNVGGEHINHGINGLLGLLGNDRIQGAQQEFGSTTGLVTQELAKFLGGGHTSDALRESLAGGLNPNSPDAKMEGFINAVKGMAAPQLRAVQGKARIPAIRQLFDAGLSPEAKAMLEGLGGDEGTGDSTPASAGPAPGTEGVINGQPAVWDGHGWLAK